MSVVLSLLWQPSRVFACLHTVAVGIVVCLVMATASASNTAVTPIFVAIAANLSTGNASENQRGFRLLDLPPQDGGFSDTKRLSEHLVPAVHSGLRFRSTGSTVNDSLVVDGVDSLNFVHSGSHLEPPVRQVLVGLSAVVAVCGILFNLAIVVALVQYRNKTLRNNITNLFVLCLGISDIVLCNLSMPLQVYYELAGWTGKAAGSDAFCRLIFASFGVPMYVSCLTIQLIAIDRHRIIVHPLRRRMSPKLALICVGAVVLFSLINSSPVAVFARSDQLCGRFVCAEQWPHRELRLAYSCSIFVFHFLLPLGVCAHAYLQTFRRLATRPGLLGSRRKDLSNKRRTTGLLVGVVVCFAVCWTPWCLFSLLMETEEYLRTLQSENRPSFSLSNTSKAECDRRLFNHVYDLQQRTVPPDGRLPAKPAFTARSIQVPVMPNHNWTLPLAVYDPPGTFVTPAAKQSMFVVPEATEAASPDFSVSWRRHLKLIDMLLKLFAMMSACVNPFLYGWLNESIRLALLSQYGRLAGLVYGKIRAQSASHYTAEESGHGLSVGYRQPRPAVCTQGNSVTSHNVDVSTRIDRWLEVKLSSKLQKNNHAGENQAAGDCFGHRSELRNGSKEMPVHIMSDGKPRHKARWRLSHGAKFIQLDSNRAGARCYCACWPGFGVGTEIVPELSPYSVRVVGDAKPNSVPRSLSPTNCSPCLQHLLSDFALVGDAKIKVNGEKSETKHLPALRECGDRSSASDNDNVNGIVTTALVNTATNSG